MSVTVSTALHIENDLLICIETERETGNKRTTGMWYLTPVTVHLSERVIGGCCLCAGWVDDEKQRETALKQQRS